MKSATSPPAGREMDSAVAEIVMGWERHDLLPSVWVAPNGVWYTTKARAATHLDGHAVTQFYFESYEGMGKVIHRMHELGFTCTIRSLNKTANQASFCGHKSNRGSARAATIPLAVSSDALKALENTDV